MSKTSIFLLVLFLIVLGSLIFLNLMYSSNPVLKSFPNLLPTQTVVSENTLSIAPATLTVTAGKPTTLEIVIDSRGEKPSLIQMELAYDPRVLSNVKLSPGNFFQNPDVLLNKVNERNGRISYAIAPSEGKEDMTGSKTLVLIQVTPRSNAVQRSTTLAFLPKTVVRTETSQNTLKNAIGARISFSGKIAPLASPSAGF